MLTVVVERPNPPPPPPPPTLARRLLEYLSMISLTITSLLVRFTLGENSTSTCKFSIGNGDGGSKIYVGEQKGGACIDACLHMKMIDDSINGVTLYFNDDNGGCWCEQNMIRISGTYKTCFLQLN